MVSIGLNSIPKRTTVLLIMNLGCDQVLDTSTFVKMGFPAVLLLYINIPRHNES